MFSLLEIYKLCCLRSITIKQKERSLDVWILSVVWMWAGPKDKKGKNYRGFALGSDLQNLSNISWELTCWVFFIKYQTLLWEAWQDRMPLTSYCKVSVPSAGQNNKCSAPYWWNRPSQFLTQFPSLISGTKKWMFSSLLVEQAQSVPDSVPSSYWRDKKMNVQLPIGGTGPVNSRLSPLLLLAEQKN